MAKNYSSDLNNKIQNEGKNLINNNQHENIDSSNNYSSIQKNLFISSDKNQNKLKETNLTMQPKLKTKKAAAKRFSLTGTGKIKRHKSNTQHILGKKSTKRKRNLNLVKYQKN